MYWPDDELPHEYGLDDMYNDPSIAPSMYWEGPEGLQDLQHVEAPSFESRRKRVFCSPFDPIATIYSLYGYDRVADT